MTSSVVEAFKNTCRTCLSTNGEMVDIFSNAYCVDQIPKKLMAFTRVEILNSDLLPKVICKKCIFLADSFYCFKEQCESADYRLKLFLQTSGGSHSSQDKNQDYLVEYISDGVKEEVENAAKRRQETERKFIMEKVSNTVKNLRGIEVLPISNANDIRSGICCRERKEELVVFPVKTERKRCRTDDTTTLNKRLRLPPETSVIRIDGENEIKREDSGVYGKYKRLNFSTVRKIVKINDEEVCVEPKEEIVNKESHGDFVTKDTANKNRDKSIGTGIVDRNENKNLQGIFREELDEIRKLESFDKYTDCEVVTMSTVGSIISGIDADDGNVKSMYGDSKDNYFEGDRSDKINEFFAENVGDGKSESIRLRAKVEGKLDLDSTEYCNNEKVNYEGFLRQADQVTPLVLLGVNSSGEENRIMNLEIYKRDDSEGVEDCSLRDPSPVSVSRIKTGDVNLRFYQCTICSMNFGSMPGVLKHNVEEHMQEESPYFCLICDKRFEDKSSISVHVEEHNGSKPYECTFCPKRFTLKRNLKRHVNYHIDYRPYKCRVCMKKFNRKSHAYLHTCDSSPFACKTCNVSFRSKTNWKRHVVTIHEKLNVVSCEFCNKELPDKRALRIHTRVHTGDRPYRCPHCDKRFTQQCNLNTHIHCHMNDRPFACPHCGKGFNQRGTRDDHILTHTGEKPHKCTECDAGFTVASALKRHMWIHTDKDRPHICKLCKIRFVGLYDLRRHLKLRHGEIVKPDNPRVERVVIDKQNNERDAFCEIGPPDKDQSSGAIEYYGKMEIPAKENNSLSCNVDKLEETEKTKKVENCVNPPKEEFVNDDETLVESSISVLHINEQ